MMMMTTWYLIWALPTTPGSCMLCHRDCEPSRKGSEPTTSNQRVEACWIVQDPSTMLQTASPWLRELADLEWGPGDDALPCSELPVQFLHSTSA